MATLGGVRHRAGGGALRPFLILFAISLLILFARDTGAARAVSSLATAALVPVQSALAAVGISADRLIQATREIETLREDNARLRETNDRLQLENVLLRERAVAAEQQARLDSAARAIPFDTVNVPVIARDPSGVLRSLMIGGGSAVGIAVGQVVLSDQGLVGRVSEAGPNYAKVMLITDTSSVISALVQGSRATGLVRGQMGETLVMDWVLQTEPVRAGDVVVTAGLAGAGALRSHYPKGLVIGKVVDVVKATDAAYLRAILTPAVDVRRLERVLVIGAAR